MKLNEWIFGYNRKTSHGSADFGGFWDKRWLMNPNHAGVYLEGSNRLREELAFKHLLLESPSGGGKTTRYILQNALRKWPQPVGLVFFDPSGEVRQLSQNWFLSQGFEVIQLNLTSLSDSALYNPLLQVTDRDSARIVAQTLIDSVYQKNDDPFWTNSSITLLTLLILGVVKGLSEEQQTLATIYELLNKLGHKQAEVDRLMQVSLDEPNFDEYCSFLGNSDKLKTSVIATAKTATHLFSDGLLRQMCAQSTFSFSQLRTRSTVLYLIQEEHRLPYYRVYWSLWFRQLFEYLMSADGNPIYFFCDEFPAYGVIPDFPSLIATLRKRFVSLSIIIQSFRQLQSGYGFENAQTILDNCSTKLYLPGLSHQSAVQVSNMLGTKTESYSPKGIFEPHQPLHRTSRQLLTPDEIRTMRKNEALLIHGNLPPFKIKMLPWYESSKLKKRSKL